MITYHSVYIWYMIHSIFNITYHSVVGRKNMLNSSVWAYIKRWHHFKIQRRGSYFNSYVIWNSEMLYKHYHWEMQCFQQVTIAVKFWTIMNHNIYDSDHSHECLCLMHITPVPCHILTLVKMLWCYPCWDIEIIQK